MSRAAWIALGILVGISFTQVLAFSPLWISGAAVVAAIGSGALGGYLEHRAQPPSEAGGEEHEATVADAVDDLHGVDEANVGYLEFYPELDEHVQYIFLDSFPFVIGRNKDAGFTLYSSRASKEHADIVRVGEELILRDLGSTNGTFVNGEKITRHKLAHGDIIHIGGYEFGFGREALPSDTSSGTHVCTSITPRSIIRPRKQLGELLDERLVEAAFQPIVCLQSGATLAFEALGRGAHTKLPADPGELFRIAGVGKTARGLSSLFREVALEESSHLPPSFRLFLNVHPSEMDDLLAGALDAVRRAVPKRVRPVLEIHESAVTDSSGMGNVRARARELGIELAYDDFGAGQSRLKELVEVSPDYLKLDMSLVRNIDQSKERRNLIRALTGVTRDLGIRLIAEGIETPAEARVCKKLGCEMAQGFLFGRPMSRESIVKRHREGFWNEKRPDLVKSLASAS